MGIKRDDDEKKKHAYIGQAPCTNGLSLTQKPKTIPYGHPVWKFEASLAGLGIDNIFKSSKLGEWKGEYS